MGLLDDRTAVVTGAGRGIGRVIADRLAAEGAAVVVADIDTAAAGDAADELTARGRRTVGRHVDVTDEHSVAALAAAATEAFGSLDVWVNNAGITRDASLRTMTLEDFRLVVDVNLQGTWLGTRAASLVMREQGRGSIVNLSSIAGKVGVITQTNYSAAKAGVVGLTKAAAKELGRFNVRVNAIQPGLIRTPMSEALSAEAFAARVAEIPLGRAGEPVEIANTALFLASDLSSYLSGTVLEVTGGRHI